LYPNAGSNNPTLRDRRELRGTGAEGLKGNMLIGGRFEERQKGINQNRADRVALYAAAAGGFSPQAYMELFDRSAETNGNKGSVLNDFFGTTTSNLSRLREIKKALKQLPQPCQEIVPAASAEFRRWQAAVMSDTDLARR
jgi:predicted Zn-dependent protease